MPALSHAGAAAPTGYSRSSNVLPRRTTKTPWNPPSPGNHEGGWLHLQPGPFSLVDAMEHYGNRRPRVERLVSAWNQGVHETTGSTGESDDPLIGASVEPSKRPRTRLSDKEVEGRSCRFDTTAVLQNLTHRTSISQKRRRNALAIRGKRTFSLTRVVPSNRRHRDRFTPTQQNPRSRGGATVAPPPRFTRKQENPCFRGPATVAAPRPSLLAPRHPLETHPGRPGSTQRFSLKTDGEKRALPWPVFHRPWQRPDRVEQVARGVKATSYATLRTGDTSSRAPALSRPGGGTRPGERSQLQDGTLPSDEEHGTTCQQK